MLIISRTFYSQNLYQNLWYKFGIESIGKKFNFKIPNAVDDYVPLAWWSDLIETSNYEAGLNLNYPYLSYGYYHASKKGLIPVSNKLYPLSWEKSASEANYDNMSILDIYYSASNISPLHSWASSELLLLLLDDTNDLKKLY